ncbi:MAG: CHAP domain-containing protein [Thiohalocapsa sp. PB-PSB1]|mgnify:CR=1 FL=1|jgi:hypothetical protein|nr:MAG: hypothetical protein N838_31790 [Thiohalocapsa sp. PB-PSB1]QQO56789.1 MAG: CHAP domain-containing protein [Thiohalocapsa sp. PB-PSB1]HCS91655.1 CHAP domain-containing protein [Chromatiaceae bacterium]
MSKERVLLNANVLYSYFLRDLLLSLFAVGHYEAKWTNRIAADIWTEIDRLTHVADQSEIPLAARLNGSSKPPRRGDLLIYAKALYGTGHVAVVLGVDPVRNLIRVGEQNFENDPWSGSNAREIAHIERAGRVWVLDPYLIGWKQEAR